MKQTISEKQAKGFFEESAILLSSGLGVILPWGAASGILGRHIIKRVLDEPVKDEAGGRIYWVSCRSKSGTSYKALTWAGLLKAVAYYNEEAIEQALSSGATGF